MNRKLDSFEKTLLKFRLLVRDLSLGPPIPASERFRLQGLRDYSWAFDQKFLGLRLMHSLCKEAAQKQDLIAVIYFESFLYFVSSALDVLASITVYFYPKDGKTLSRQVYFKDQMNETFLKSPNINPDYAKLLSENRRWIEDALDKRDAHAHKASPLMAIEKDGRPIIEKRHRFDDKTPARKREFEDMLRCIEGKG